MIIFKKLLFDQDAALKKRQLHTGGRVQKYVDNECIKLMDPLTPFKDGGLKSAPINQTVIGSGKIVQRTPYAKSYAKRWYYEPANFSGAPRRGNKWFERMKVQHGKQILRGAAREAGARSE